MLLVELDVLAVDLVALFEVGLPVVRGQPVLQQTVFEVSIAWERREEVRVIHFTVPGVLIAGEDGEPTEASDIE